MASLKVILAPGSLALLALAIAVGVAAMRRRGRVARAARIWIATWIAVYVLLSLPVVAGALYAGLDTGAPLTSAQQAPGTQVVVLLSGSARRYPVGGEPLPVMDLATTLRAIETARVYRLIGSPIVVVSGAGEAGEESPAVQATAEALRAAGVPADRLVLEVRSRDTHASAIAVRELLRERGLSGVVLVTSAQHMPRAARAFRAAGVAVTVSPAPMIPGGFKRGLRAWLPDARALLISEACLHEYIGIAYYGLRGWG